MNIVYWIIFTLYICTKFFLIFLEYQNSRHLRLNTGNIPVEFDDVLDKEKLEKIQSYTVEKTNIGILNTLYNSTIVLLFLFGGGLGIYTDYIAKLGMSPYLNGIIFFNGIIIAYTILEIPFDLYSTFLLEKKYGFNTTTPKLWIADFIKSVLISTILVSIIVSALLFTISTFSNSWWVICWGLFLILTVFMMYISPYVLEPLFNKFLPVEDEEIVNGLKDTFRRIGLRVSKVLKMDASKRTKHTNAYFTGIGPVKRIVLYDTLIEKMNAAEIVSVIAHEAGHWKKKHIIKNLALFELLSLIFFYIAFRLTESGYLLNLFSVSSSAGTGNIFYVSISIFIIYFIAGIVLFPITPLFNLMSRHFEYEADEFAVKLVNGSENLRSALIKLSADNLSNPYPHPLYEIFHYSHPAILKRLSYLSEMDDEFKKE